MPPTLFDDPAHAAALASHVKGLLKPGAEDRLVQRRLSVVARRVGRLPAAAGQDAGFEACEEQEVVLAPLVWHDAAPLRAGICALHDGNEIAIRLRWADPTADDRLLGGSGHPDAAAIQFSESAGPPLFGMGSAATPLRIWRWRAFRPDDAAGALELAAAERLHRLPDEDEGESVEARGPGSVRAFTASSVEIAAKAERTAGGWQVVFRRTLAGSDPADVHFASGAAVQAAIAIWNGSSGDHGIKKSISLWNELRLE